MVQSEVVTVKGLAATIDADSNSTRIADTADGRGYPINIWGLAFVDFRGEGAIGSIIVVALAVGILGP